MTGSITFRMGEIAANASEPSDMKPNVIHACGGWTVVVECATWLDRILNLERPSQFQFAFKGKFQIPSGICNAIT
jgi:hypothetical protein